MANKKKIIDVTRQNQGTLHLFILHTKAAQEWVEANVQIEDYMRLGKNFACEWRFADAIVGGMIEAGLVVK